MQMDFMSVGFPPGRLASTLLSEPALGPPFLKLILAAGVSWGDTVCSPSLEGIADCKRQFTGRGGGKLMVSPTPGISVSHAQMSSHLYGTKYFLHDVCLIHMHFTIICLISFMN